MKGTIIKTRAQILVEQGIEQGIKRGIKQGKQQGKSQGIKQGIALKTLADQVRDRALSVEQAAARMSLSTEDFTARCRKYGLKL